jgi:hypothetical protein
MALLEQWIGLEQITSATEVPLGTAPRVADRNPLFTRVRGTGILRTSPKQNSRTLVLLTRDNIP